MAEQSANEQNYSCQRSQLCKCSCPKIKFYTLKTKIYQNRINLGQSILRIAKYENTKINSSIEQLLKFVVGKILVMQKYDSNGEETFFLVFPIRAESQRQLFERAALRISNKIRTSARLKLVPTKLSQFSHCLLNLSQLVLTKGRLSKTDEFSEEEKLPRGGEKQVISNSKISLHIFCIFVQKFWS